MEVPLIAAFVSAVSAVIVAGVTYSLTKRREQELEWRKLKLEHYRAYLAALSGVVGSRSTVDNQKQYAESVNSLQLVAPETIITALYNYQYAISYRNLESSVDSHNRALTKLLHAMRMDVHPALKHKPAFQFRLFDVPPEVENT